MSIWGEGCIDPTAFEALWRPNSISYALNVDQYLLREVHQLHQKKHFEPILKNDRVKIIFINEKQGNSYLTYGISPMLSSQVYMGSVPDMPLSYVWDHSPETSQIFHDTFQARSPIQGSGRPMGLVPYMSLMHVWGQSHVLLKDYCGTCPIKYMGLQNKQTHKTSMTTLNQVVPFMVLRDPWD